MGNRVNSANSELKMNICLTCRRRLRTCVCEHIIPFDTKSRFIILMHPKEFKKEKVGTGRFTHLALKNSKIIVDIGFDDNNEFKAYLNDQVYQSFVLYPGENAFNLSGSESFLKSDSRPAQFFVIDGTWSCAKKMMKLTTFLHDLPRVSFTTNRVSEFKVKHQPLPECLSTVESIHQVIIELNRLKIEETNMSHDNLMDIFRHTVKQQIELAADEKNQGYRRKPYSAPEAKKISKKWSDRLLFFKSPSS